MNRKEFYMKRALELAALGEGKTSPNPMVGCVVVKGNQILAEGFHEGYGGFHAERNALLSCNAETQGAELYVNLEPCCHQGKTPPCTDIILEKKIKKVYIGCLDTNPLVAGKGVERLRKCGVTVESGILEQESRKLNEVFFYHMQEQLPFVAMKYAMTLDGKIACETGDSKWVTGTEAREQVQRLRNRYRGIMTGIKTVLMDDPMLNCRMKGGRDPVRIICDSRLRIPTDSRIAETAGQIRTILAYHSSSPEKEEFLKEKGIELLKIPTEADGNLELYALLKELELRGIDSILLEGGGTLNASMLKKGLVQRVYAFVAPKLVAGAKAKSPVEGRGIPMMKHAVGLYDVETKQYGRDFCITGTIRR